MTRKILYAAGIMALALVIVGVFLPSTVHVQREVTIDAPAATVFALLTDARQLEEWSPWIASENVDTQVEGPSRGVGATLRWNLPAGGSGSQAIVQSAPYERVVTELSAGGKGGKGPFASTFTLDTREGGTRVGWAFDADFGVNLVQRYFGRLLAGRIGRDYEQGLANLKSMAESLPRADWSDLQIEHLDVEPAPIAYLTTSSLPDSEAVSEAMGEAYFR
ncbi:MAG: SRPBCC family protein, partial [Woeseiaceae bacterium]